MTTNQSAWVDGRLSVVIDTMRFPLIYLVVVAHMLPFAAQEIVWPTDANGLYVVLSELFSHHLAKLSVRCYFLIAGFLFFAPYQQGIWSFYKIQLRKKAVNLLVPYLCWNGMMLLAIVLKNQLFTALGRGADDGLAYIQTASWSHLFWESPVNFPLWYLRDLMCMVLLAPLFYFGVRRLGVFFLIALGCLYMSPLELPIAGFGTTALFFFGTGTYFAIKRIDLLAICHTCRYVSSSIAGIALLLCFVYSGTPYHPLLTKVFLVAGTLATIHVFDRWSAKIGWQKRLRGLGSLTFFIYVTHEIYIINWLKGAFYEAGFYGNGWFKLVVYVMTPLVCVGVCTGLFLLCRRFFPQVLARSLGNRVHLYSERRKAMN